MIQYFVFLVFLILSSCTGSGKGSAGGDLSSSSEITVTSASQSGLNVTIVGTGLDKVSSVKLKQSSSESNLTISSQTATQIVGVIASNLALATNQVAELIFNTANAQVTATLTLNLSGTTVTNFTSTGITDSASSTAMTLTSAGNVGFGTSTPTGFFEVLGGTAATGVAGKNITIKAQNGDNGNAGSLNLSAGDSNATGSSSGAGANIVLGGNTNGGQDGGNVTISAGNGNNNAAPGTITLTSGATANGVSGAVTITTGPGNNNKSGNIFIVPGTPGGASGAGNVILAMTSAGTARGNVGIGVAVPLHTLHVVGDAGLSTGTAWTNASDIRLKDVHGDYEYGLNEILKLHTVRFSYKKENPMHLPSDRQMTGFIAQEVQKVIPEAVRENQKGYLELNVDPIHWASVNAIQELNTKVVALKAENELLKKELEKIKKHMGLK